MFENHVSFEGNESYIPTPCLPIRFENHVSFEGNIAGEKNGSKEWLFENHVSFEGNEAREWRESNPQEVENHVSFEGNEAQAKLNEATWLSFDAKKRAVTQCFDMLHSSLFDFSLC